MVPPVQALAVIALLSFAPPDDAAGGDRDAAASSVVEGPAPASKEAEPPPEDEPPPESEPPPEGQTSPEGEPPPPTLEGPPPEVPPTPEGAEALRADPEGDEIGGTTPPGEGAGGVDPEGARREPDPAEIEAAIAAAEDLPYAATAARKSAVRRNNDVMIRSFRKPVYSIAASARLGALLAGGQRIVTPVGWGAAVQLRIHALRVFRSRFGVELHAGHTRFQRRRDYETFTDATVTRATLLTHTDFSAGPSFQVPIGAVFVQAGASAGVSLSTLSRPISADPGEDEQISEPNALVRGGVSIGIPILNRHGLSVGAGIQQVFSRREVLVDREVPDGAKTDPFGTVFEAFLGYSIWF